MNLTDFNLKKLFCEIDAKFPCFREKSGFAPELLRANDDFSIQRVVKNFLVDRGLRLDISYLPGQSKWRVDIVPQGPNETAVRAECGTECEALLLAFRNYLEVNNADSPT